MASALVLPDTATPDPARRGPDTKLLGRTASTVDNRAATVARQIHRWMRRYALAEARRQIAEFERSSYARYVFAKAEPPSRRDLEAELWRILTTSGLAVFRSSARRTVGSRKVVLTDQATRAFLADKRIKLQQIMKTTHRAVTDSVRQIMLTALDEDPRPSTTEIGRRIARVYHGDAGGEEIARVPAPLTGSRVLPTQRVSTDPKGNLYVFSFERAALIARTELAQAENEGIVEGYRATGVEGLRWLAYRDGRSGDRRHNEMHGETVRLGETFELPDGTRMRYPGDSRAPIKHLANCRCTVAPVMIME